MTRPRAQVLPLWIFGMLGMLACMFFVLNSAEALRWQIQAQNAADAAAAAGVAVQSQRFNQMELQLYVLSLEEYRTKRLIDNLEVVANASGGCIDVAKVNNGNGNVVGSGKNGAQDNCASIYQSMRDELAKSVNRYTSEVVQFAQNQAAVTAPNVDADVRSVVASIANNCGKVGGGDCNFAYTIFDSGINRMWWRHNVTMDSKYLHRNACCANTSDSFRPLNVEVVVCHEYTPIVSQFFGLSTGKRRAVARGSYTDVAVTSEWFQPGYLVNPITNKPFQPAETYSTTPSLDGLAGENDWYSVVFSGASWTAANGGYTSNGASNLGETDRYIQWWGPMTDHPQSSLVLSGTDQVPCK